MILSSRNLARNGRYQSEYHTLTTPSINGSILIHNTEPLLYQRSLKTGPFISIIMSDEELLKKLELKLDILEINSRKMFGGIGIFSEKIMFSLIYNGVLYFRSTQELASKYSRDSCQFEHPSRDSKMPYWSVPEQILNDKAKLSDWAYNAFSLARSLKK
jgi:DNA transformation protein